MANLDDVLIFVKVAQFESISRAARSLGMPISTVSRRLSVLESKLGVSLLRRTTRRVTLTAQGREYFNQCKGAADLVMGPSSPRTVGINSETVGWMCTVFCRVVYGTFAAMMSMIE